MTTPQALVDRYLAWKTLDVETVVQQLFDDCMSGIARTYARGGDSWGIDFDGWGVLLGDSGQWGCNTRLCAVMEALAKRLRDAGFLRSTVNLGQFLPRYSTPAR